MNKTPFLKLYYNILNDKNLTITDKVVYSFIDALSQKDGYCYASNIALSKKIGISDHAVQNSINKLLELHYITKWKLKNEHKNYRMITTNKSILENGEEFKELKKKARENVALFDYDWLNERD